MNKTILSLISVLLISFSAKSQDITGPWYGVLDVKVAKLRLVLNITKKETGYSSTLDSPDQGASGISVDKTTFEKHSLEFGLSKLGVTYKGTFIPDSNVISGTFTQGGASFPLKFSRTEGGPAAKVPRPQDPKSFPYRQEEVEFASLKGANKLSGTLTIPATGKISRIVVLISGSGPQDRNEEISQFNHRPFLVWSDWLTRNGIAVIRYDDRGTGKSTGNFNTATTSDFANDAEGAVNYILSRPDLKNLSIGLLGHSEGGMIAAMVASRNKAVKFLVLLSAPGIPVSELMEHQTEDQMRLTKADQKLIEYQLQNSRFLYSTIKKYHNLAPADLKKSADSVLTLYMKSHPENVPPQMSAQEAIERSAALVTNPWWRYFINFDPAEYLSQVKCPVIALNGTLDSQVRASENLRGIGASLMRACNKRYELHPMAQLNHMLQRAGTGRVEEYAEIDETVNPEALTTVSSWISKLK